MRIFRIHINISTDERLCKDCKDAARSGVICLWVGGSFFKHILRDCMRSLVKLFDVVHFALSVAAFFTRTMQMAQSLLCNLRLAKASNTTRRTTPNDVVFFYPYLIQNWRFEVTVKENSKYCYMYYSTYLAHIALSTTHRQR